MKKHVLIWCLALFGAMCSLTASAQMGITYVDDVPFTRYINNIHLENNSLVFSDSYQQGTAMHRHYKLRFLEVEADDAYNHLGYRFTPSDCLFIPYGTVLLKLTYNMYDCDVTQPIEWTSMSTLMETCMKRGIRRVRVLVIPYFSYNKQDLIFYYDTYDCDAMIYANHATLDLPAGMIERQTPAQQSITVGENTEISMSYKVYAVGEMRTAWEISKDNGATWSGYCTGDYYNLSRARNGITETMDLNGLTVYGHYDNLLFRLRADVYTSEEVKESVYSDVITVGVKHNYSINTYTGNSDQPHSDTVAKLAGEQCMFWVDPCQEYSIDCDMAIELSESPDNGQTMVQFDMPATPVTVNLRSQAAHTVEFRDFDGTLLSSQQVACGGTATAPSLPNHANLTFDKWWSWSGDYSASKTVEEDIVYHARYTLQNLTATATQDHHSQSADFVNQPGKLLLGDTIWFGLHLVTPLYANIRAQLTRDGGNTWENAYMFSVMADEATQGYDLSPVWYTFNNYMNNGESFGLRWQISSGGLTIYTEPLIYSIYSSVTVSADNVAIGAGIPGKNGYQIEVGQSHELYVRRGDTIALNVRQGVNSDCLHFTAQNTILTDDNHGLRNGNPYFISQGINDVLSVGVTTYRVYFQVLGCGRPHGINNVYEIADVPCGQGVDVPTVSNPLVPNSPFLYWLDENTGDTANFASVTDDIWAMAIFDEPIVRPTYTVVFNDWNGSLLGQLTVKEGENAVWPTTPEREGYVFTGWLPLPETVVADMTVTAQYEQFTPEVLSSLQALYDQHTNLPTQKVLYNGHIYIIRAGRIYDAQGRLME